MQINENLTMKPIGYALLFKDTYSVGCIYTIGWYYNYTNSMVRYTSPFYQYDIVLPENVPSSISVHKQITKDLLGSCPITSGMKILECFEDSDGFVECKVYKEFTDEQEVHNYFNTI